MGADGKMTCYEVGGAVRDALLGLPVHDRDWVVVGSTPEALEAAGFLPVGRDFPVFLHPETKEEYALARTERKHGRGYRGFRVHCAPQVTLEEDLQRRDLTINAIARAEDGTLIDPFGGQRDLQERWLRHVSPAFAEDPVRVLRLARFAARFGDFRVAPETLALARSMAEAGELAHLVPERVWQEFSRGLMEAHPERMISVLYETGALAVILPEVAAMFGVPQPPQHHPEGDCGAHLLLVLQTAARLGAPLEVRWACLLHDTGKGDTPADILPHHYGHEERSAQHAEAICARLRVPTACRDFARCFAREHGHLYRLDEMRPGTVVQLLQRCDALRRPARFEAMLLAAACDHLGRGGVPQDAQWTQAERWRQALAAVRAVDAGALARACQDRPQAIAEVVLAARVQAVRAVLHPSTAAVR